MARPARVASSESQRSAPDVFVLDLARGEISRWEAHRLLDAFLLEAETRRRGDRRQAAKALGMDIDATDPAPTSAPRVPDPFTRALNRHLP